MTQRYHERADGNLHGASRIWSATLPIPPRPCNAVIVMTDGQYNYDGDMLAGELELTSGYLKEAMGVSMVCNSGCGHICSGPEQPIPGRICPAGHG